MKIPHNTHSLKYYLHQYSYVFRKCRRPSIVPLLVSDIGEGGYSAVCHLTLLYQMSPCRTPCRVDLPTVTGNRWKPTETSSNMNATYMETADCPKSTQATELIEEKNGAQSRIRTKDTRIFNQLLNPQIQRFAVVKLSNQHPTINHLASICQTCRSAARQGFATKARRRSTKLRPGSGPAIMPTSKRSSRR